MTYTLLIVKDSRIQRDLRLAKEAAKEELEKDKGTDNNFDVLVCI